MTQLVSWRIVKVHDIQKVVKSLRGLSNLFRWKMTFSGRFDTNFEVFEVKALKNNATQNAVPTKHRIFDKKVGHSRSLFLYFNTVHSK